MNQQQNKILESLQEYAQRHGLMSVKDLHFKAALIDMDGTLYDSMGYHTLAWHRMLLDIGIDTDRNRFYHFEGMTGKATVNLLFREYLHRDATDEEVALPALR